MTRPLGLPSTLRTKLAALVRRIHLLQAIRGASLLVLAFVLLVGGLFLADTLLVLPPEALRIGLLATLGVTALVAVFGLVVPVCRSVDTEALAALIEEKYPELGERLTTTVELADNTDAWHGSRALIDLLIEETERRAHPLDFGRAFSARFAGWMALTAVAGVLVAGLPALVWGESYADFGNRLVGAWIPAAAPTGPTFAFQVAPGDSFAARGRPLNLLVLVHPRDGTPPTACNLAYTDAGTPRVLGAGKTVRVRMPAEPALLPALAAGAVANVPLSPLPLPAAANLLSGARPGTRAFSFQFDRLTGDLPFHVEVGEACSDRYTITAVDPVELAPNSPTIAIAAPAYTNKTVHPTQTLSPGTDLFAFEYGSVRLDCRFTRPAVRASLEISARGETGKNSLLGDSWRLPLPLTGDRQQASYEVPSLRRGSYDLRLILEAEHGITTRYDLRPLAVQHDEPPAFTRKPDTKGVQATEARRDWAVGADPTGAQFNPVRGGLAYDRARQVAPDDTLKLKVTVEDALGVENVELEYRVNEGPSRFETIAAGAGQLKVEPPQGEYAFQLAGKVKDGDLVLYRLRASDNRQVAKASFKDATGLAVPAAALTPHIVYHPERAQGKDRWFMLRINRKADPVARQEILEERDRIRQKLDAIQKKLTRERTQLNKVRNETRTRPQLSPEQKTSLNALRRDNREIRGDLRQLAEDADQTPALRPIADTAQQVADKEMAHSDEALHQAQNKKADAPKRAQQLQKADEELARAQKQLELLKQTNDKVAQQRLDQLKMQNLANQQQELERRAADLAAKNPQDPQAKRDLDELRAEQNQVADELKRLAEQSELFRDALNATRADDAKKLADEAKQLAQAQRDLTQAKEDTFKKETAGKFGDLARKQQELAVKAANLAKETAQPAKLANKQPLKADDAQKAADAIKEGNLAEAVQKQDQTAKELERLAADFDKALDLARDPREAARQLAALQDNLKKRLTDEVKKKDNTPLAQRLKQLQPEQEALQRAVKALAVPEAMRDAKDMQKRAADRAADAARALQQQNPAAAKNQMEQAKQALAQLANRLPTLDQRRQQALQQVADIRRQQEDVGRQAEAVLKQFEKQDPQKPQTKAQLNRVLAQNAHRQAQLAERLAKLDVPNQEARQEKAEKAMTKALNDLVDAQAQDVPASQQEARRELDRLEKALRGQQPDDEKARELARKQKQLNNEAAKLAADPKATPAQVKALQDKQQQIAKETQALPAKQEAPLQAAVAAKATKQAADAVKAQATQPAAREKMAEAAQALEKLADQLAGKETDAARADRLAQEQAKLAAAAQKEPGKANAPAAQQAQQQIADEAKQIRAGEDAQGEKKAATAALAKAQQPGQKPADQARAQRAAADALKDLADKLAGRDNAAKAAELARQQRDLANQAGAKKDPLLERPEQEAERLAELARKAAQKQAELARQTQRLDAKGALQAQKEAAQQMAAAQKALDQARTPGEAKDALARAADAADKLAKELARAQAANKPANPNPTPHTVARPGEQTPKQAAQQLARQQKQLAQATQKAQQQAAGKPGAQGKQALEQAMQALAKQQAQLNQQAAQLPANKAETALEKARQAMNQAQQSLQKNNPGEAQRKQQDAANALDQLARQLPDKMPTQAGAKEPGATPQGLPTKQQAEQARQLAQAQKELRDAVQKMAAEATALRKTQPGENPLGELGRKQQDVAQKAAELAKDVAKEQGQQAPVAKQAQEAAQQAQQAAQQAQAGATPQALKAGQQLADQLRKLAQDLNQTPRGDAAPKGTDPAQRAAQLAKTQEELNKQMQPLAGNTAAQKAQQEARQGELAKQTGDLTKELGKLGQKTAQAAQAAQQGQNAMQQAQAQAKQGNEGKAGEAGKQAAQLLDKAAQQAAQAAQQMAGQKPGQPGFPNQAAKEAGEAVKQGQEQVGQAQAKLGQGQPKAAQGAMQKAAAAMQKAASQAAQQMAKANESGERNEFAKESGPKGAAGTGLPDLSMFGKEMKKYAGRAWGDLPGELRTQILQSMRARYGEDYAGIIQRYFEQIADTNRSRRK